MAITLTATETKARILALLDVVAGGEEVESTKHGRVVARLVPARGPHALRNKFADEVVVTVEDEDDLFTTGLSWAVET